MTAEDDAIDQANRDISRIRGHDIAEALENQMREMDTIFKPETVSRDGGFVTAQCLDGRKIVITVQAI